LVKNRAPLGLGKTIEAALIARGLLLRKNVREIIASCPPSMLLQWQDEAKNHRARDPRRWSRELVEGTPKRNRRSRRRDKAPTSRLDIVSASPSTRPDLDPACDIRVPNSAYVVINAPTRCLSLGLTARRISARQFFEAVNLGDDADTTGAVCGQLAGAYWGVEGIPPEWLDGLAKREELETAVGALQGACS